MRTRILSFILALCLASSSVCIFARENADKTSEIQQESATILNALGVLRGTTAGEMSVTAKVSKIDFIDLYMSILYSDNKVSKEVSPFKDVTPDMKGYDSVCSAYDMGIISGGGDGNFSPNSYISYNEAMKIVVSLLGYEEPALGKGGYPLGYISIAKQLDITDGVKAEEEMSWGNCAVMLLNTLEAPMSEIYGWNGNTVHYTKGESVFYNIFKIRKDRGVVKVNQYTTLTEAGGIGGNTITIGNFTGKIYNGVMHEVYLGYEVDFYYKIEDYDNCVLYMSPSVRNKAEKILSEDMGGLDENNVLTYYTGKAEKKVTIPAFATVIVNGEAKPEYTSADFEKDDAEFVLVDNDGNGTVDVVNITAWDTIYVNTVNKESQVITDKYDISCRLDLKVAENSILWNDSFEEIGLEDIKTGTVITYVKSESGKYIRGIVGSKFVSGEIRSINEKSGYKILNIDGEKYTVAKSYAKKNAFNAKTGERVTAYLDYTGKIAAVEVMQTTSDYGYLIAGAIEEDMDTQIQVKLLQHNGKIGIAPLHKNAKIDGIFVKDMSNEGLLQILNTPQVIYYSADAGGNIRKIDTVGDYDGNDNLLFETQPLGTLNYFAGTGGIFVGTGTGVAYDRNKVWYSQLVMNNATKVIVAPKDVKGALDEDFGIYNSSYFSSTGRYTVQAVTTDKESFIPEVIYVQPDSLAGEMDNPSLIEDIYLAVDSEGDFVIRVHTISYRGVKGQYDIPADNEEIADMNLKVGDFIMFSLNVKGQIKALDRLYSQELKAYDPTSSQTAMVYYGNDFVPRMGKVYDRHMDTIAYVENTDMESVEVKDLQFFIPKSTTLIYVVEEDARFGQRVRVGTIEDCYDYKHYGEASDIFYALQNTTPRILVIYR